MGIPQRFQSTHPARGATLRSERLCGSTNFNPRTPRGVRLLLDFDGVFCSEFQSTHPARGATVCPSTWVNGQRISIHAPREGCDWISDCSRLLTSPISIHAPREGCDPPCLIDPVQVNGFQSTHPARGATANFTKEQRVCLAQFAYLHKGKKAEHTKTNAPMLH